MAMRYNYYDCNKSKTDEPVLFTFTLLWIQLKESSMVQIVMEILLRTKKWPLPRQEYEKLYLWLAVIIIQVSFFLNCRSKNRMNFCTLSTIEKLIAIFRMKQFPQIVWILPRVVQEPKMWRWKVKVDDQTGTISHRLSAWRLHAYFIGCAPRAMPIF